MIWFFRGRINLFFLLLFSKHYPRVRQLYLLIEGDQILFQLAQYLDNNFRYWEQVQVLIVYLNSSYTTQQCDYLLFFNIIVTFLNWLTYERSLFKLQAQFVQVLFSMQLDLNQLPFDDPEMYRYQVVLQDSLPFLWVFARVYDLFQKRLFYKRFLFVLTWGILTWLWLIRI